jgi:hypothetical protein
LTSFKNNKKNQPKRPSQNGWFQNNLHFGQVENGDIWDNFWSIIPILKTMFSYSATM